MHDGISIINICCKTREGGKIKGSDEKEAIGNELSGNAFFRERCQEHAAIKAGWLHDGEVLLPFKDAWFKAPLWLAFLTVTP
ncbi:TPA: hypothetical protein HA361_02865 [Candidatus Woesearchaeota archaeon]|nr:hypothetical protein [Candidatus Woesearchaeota archaeon]